jgi:hypothetical protein
MTREEFVKRGIRAYMILDYINPRVEGIHEISVCSVDFDTEIVEARFLEDGLDSEPRSFHISMLFFQDKKIKNLKPC